MLSMVTKVQRGTGVWGQNLGAKMSQIGVVGISHTNCGSSLWKLLCVHFIFCISWYYILSLCFFILTMLWCVCNELLVILYELLVYFCLGNLNFNIIITKCECTFLLYILSCNASECYVDDVFSSMLTTPICCESDVQKTECGWFID